jgi:Protein of unknown function (DUF3631)
MTYDYVGAALAGAKANRHSKVTQVIELDTVAADRLLGDVAAFIGRYIAYPNDHAQIAHTLWITHTHLMESWESTPRLAFLSPEPGSGKTRALEVSELLTPNPVEAVNMSSAYLFRRIGAGTGLPTILYDEVDALFGGKSQTAEEIRALLNSGHRRGAVVGRCVVHGKTIKTEESPAFCAVALAGLGFLPDTLMSRSVIIRMRRRAPSEQVEPFRRREAQSQGHKLRDRLARWGSSVAAEIAQARPVMPPTVTDRAADCWEPLLAIADTVGGHWPEIARTAAVTLVTAAREANPSLGIRLLEDCRSAFQQDDRLPTEQLLHRLAALPESPWTNLKGKPLDDRGLAARLRKYDIRPDVIRVGETTARGYMRACFEDAWGRYLSPRQDT